MDHSIASLLQQRGAWLKGMGNDPSVARRRTSLTRSIADYFPVFEQVRDRLFQPHATLASHMNYIREVLPAEASDLLLSMMQHGVIKTELEEEQICEVAGRRYLGGGWLEELAWLAAQETSHEEALYGQNIGWNVKNFSGENEIDLIVRHKDRLGFLSCKALRSNLDIKDRKHRNRLMDAVHEADNLADHFGRPGERVAVLVTTDLYDEARNSPRYVALMGKAAVLDVRVIALEELAWEKLVAAMAELIEMTEEGGQL